MAELKISNEIKMVALPPLRMVLSDHPGIIHDPTQKQKGSRMTDKEMQSNIRKLIDHLKENK